MEHILAAIQDGATGDDIAHLAIPESYRAAFVRRDEVDMFEGMESGDDRAARDLERVRSRVLVRVKLFARLDLEFIPVTAADHIVATASVDAIVPVSAVDPVVSGTAANPVVAVSAIKEVIPRPPVDQISAGKAL